MMGPKERAFSVVSPKRLSLLLKFHLIHSLKLSCYEVERLFYLFRKALDFYVLISLSLPALLFCGEREIDAVLALVFMI